MPLSGSTDTFSGQFLRLEEYIGPSENRHLPSSLPPASGLVGIAISSTGYFIVKVMADAIETFGKALTEKISDAAHHIITIDKGDWTLKVEEGEVSISATKTDKTGTVTFKSTGSDVYFDALLGTAHTKDRWNVKESKQNSVTFVMAFEYSAVAGLYVKDNRGFIFTVNVLGTLSVKLLEIKGEAFPMKINFGMNLSTFAYSLKFQLISWAWRKIDTKVVMFYQKISWMQVYQEMAVKEIKALKLDTKAAGQHQGNIVKAEEAALKIGFRQLIFM